MFKTFGLSQLISNITRPTTAGGTCIDWIVTNCRFVQSANVSNIFLSDHFAVECVRKKARECKKNVWRSVRNYKNYNKEIMCTLLLAKLQDSDFNITPNPDDKCEILSDMVLEILSVMCPYKRYRQQEVNTPWMSAPIYRNIRYQDSLVNLSRITRNSLYLTLMKQQRNVVNSLIDTAKKEYISALLDKNKSCPMKFWRCINQFLKGDYGVYHHPRFIDPVSGTEIPLGNEPTFLNDNFCNISRRLGFDPNDEVSYSDNDYLACYDNVNEVFDLLSDPLTSDELLLYASDIDVSKNCCIEGLTSSICKDLLILLPETFVSIFESSIDTQIFPSTWSKGTVIVIPKSGDPCPIGDLLLRHLYLQKSWKKLFIGDCFNFLILSHLFSMASAQGN